MDKILSVENVSKSIKKMDILKDISFELRAGEIVGLIGENGAGKTSIMRILVGLTKEYGGTLKWEQVNRIGCLIETPNFYPYMSGKENLEYFASLKNVPQEEVIQLLKALKLESFSNRKVKGYSLGMRQRLGVAQALLGNPQVLILDEPTNGLDPSGIKEIREYLKAIVKEKNIAILISSHALGEMEKLCDRALFIKNGKLEREITINKEAVQCLYIITNNNELANVVLKNQGFQTNIKAEYLEIFACEYNKREILLLLQQKDLSILDVVEKKRELEEQYMNLLREEG